MKLENFYTFTDYTSQYKLNKIVPRPYLQDIVFVKFERGKRHLNFKTDFNTPLFTELNFLLSKFEKGVLPSPTSKTHERGISTERKRNLLIKLNGIVPKNRLLFWQNLTEVDTETDNLE